MPDEEDNSIGHLLAALSARLDAIEQRVGPPPGAEQPPMDSAEGVAKVLQWRTDDFRGELDRLDAKINEVAKRIRPPEEPQAESACGGTTSTTIGAGSEGSETEDTTEYDVSEGGNVKLWVVTRVVYNESGDQKLYAFARPVTFAACHVGPETRYVVDAPTECDPP